MSAYDFEIVVSGYDPSILDEDLAAFGALAARLDDLGEADISLSLQGGLVSVEVWRDDCASPKEALFKTFAELKTLGLSPVRVLPDDLVTAAEIAERLERTPASISQLASGARGPGGFPAPVRRLETRSRLYSYLRVLEWAEVAIPELSKDGQVFDRVRLAKTIKLANSALDLLSEKMVSEEQFTQLICD